MNLRMPAEWTAHDGVWIGFPWDAREWPGMLAAAQEEIAGFANAVHDDGAGEAVTIVTGSSEAAARAQSLCNPEIKVMQRQIGDCWLRDTGCIIAGQDGERVARNFRFNGWGGKYLMAGDETIGRELAEDAGLRVTDCDWVLEGGAIDVDGTGLAVTTRQCLLNPNRNGNMQQGDIEAALARDLGISRLLWLDDGLAGDHTDGHVDNLARFVAPEHILIPQAQGSDDPNNDIYEDAAARAAEFGLRVSHLPSPGRYRTKGDVAPASYMNFYIGNRCVIVPAFGLPSDEDARTRIAKLFPGRKALSLPSAALLSGGGSFHCCSQQIPS